MFAEPSNATIVRFLSNINEQLADSADVVLYHVVLQMEGQEGYAYNMGFFIKTCFSSELPKACFNFRKI